MRRDTASSSAPSTSTSAGTAPPRTSRRTLSATRREKQRGPNATRSEARALLYGGQNALPEDPAAAPVVQAGLRGAPAEEALTVACESLKPPRRQQQHQQQEQE